MRRLYFLTVLFFIVFLATGCSKGNSGGGGAGPQSPTVVDITQPTPGTIVLNGSTLTVEGTITDNNIISIAKVEIKNKVSGAVLYTSSTSTPNVSFYRFLWSYTVTGVSSSFVATIKVTGRDTQGSEGVKEIEVTMVP